MSKSRATTQSARKSLGRNAGRPPEDKSVGRETILQAAVTLLRHKTVEQLTVSEVAATANVDRALVRYYFSNKTGLLKSIAIELLGELQARSLEALEADASLEEKIRMRLKLLIDIMHEMPQFEQLVFKEIYYAERAQALDGSGSTKIAQTVADRGLALTKAIIDSPEVDALGHAMEPRFLHIMMLGAAVFFATSQPLLQLMFGETVNKDELTTRYIEFVTTMLMRGLGAAIPT